jgi:hypothetical protein
MGQLVVSNLVSLDCFFSGPEGEIDWHVVDADFHVYQHHRPNTIGKKKW